jgi:hypothetical protein
MPAAAGFARRWTKRVRSPAFERALRALIADEVRAAARDRVKDVVDARRVRRLIERADPAVFDEQVLTELVLEAGRVVRARLRAKKKPLRDLLDAELTEGIETLLAEPIVLTRRAEDLVGQLMSTALVRDLFTDVVHTSIVSFNKRINPLFGGVTMAALEPQIKGFIRMFVPMLQKQAAGFVVGEQNRLVFADFTASVVRELLREPLPGLLALVAGGGRAGRAQTRALVRALLRGPKVQALQREMALAVWDAAFARLRGSRLGDLVALEENAEPIAAEIAAAMRPLLVRPSVIAFLEREVLSVDPEADRGAGRTWRRTARSKASSRRSHARLRARGLR